MHQCQNRRGVVRCECHPGYRLAADSQACEGTVPTMQRAWRETQPLVLLMLVANIVTNEPYAFPEVQLRKASKISCD